MKIAITVGALISIGAAVLWFAASRRPVAEPAAAPAPAVVSTPHRHLPSPSPAGETAPTARSVVEAASDDELSAAIRARLAAGATSEEILAALEVLANRDPARALDLACALARNPEEKHAWATALLQQWAKREPDLAWAWVRGALAESIVGEPSPLVTVLTVVVARDPSQALEWIHAATNAGTPLGKLAGGFIEAMLAVGRGDEARAITEKLAASHPDQLTNADFERLALDMARLSRPAAGTWLLELPPGEARNLAVATLAAHWAESAPAEAMQWASGLDPTQGRGDAMQRVFDRWAATDMPAAAQWVAENESHPATDALIVNLVSDSTLPQNNPRLAVQWAGLLTDPALRSQNVESVILGWSRRDRDAAIAFVSANPVLPREQQERLLETLRNRPPPSPEN